MFTGIIEELGRVVGINRELDNLKLIVSADRVIGDMSIGSSISINGICLTVVRLNKNSFEVDVVSETIKRTNLNELKEGSLVNLERPMKISGKLEGHFVLGHIDGIGIINKKENSSIIEIKLLDYELTKYIVSKGSVAIDGISLTIVDVFYDNFRVAIIPYTSKNTTLGFKNIGDKVNIEVDIIAKHIEKLLGRTEYQKNKITMEFLEKHGY